MVYCGKPSKGCSNCRERKVRCDQKEPGCGQCEKRKQTCPGYRNLVDLMFRDESSHVINKAAKTRSRNHSRARSRTPRKRVIAGAGGGGGGAASASTTASITSSPSSAPAPSPGLLRPPTFSVSTPASIQSWFQEESPESMEGSRGHEGAGSPSKDDISTYLPSRSLQERGTAFFFSRYVTTDNACHQNYNFIYDIWKPSDPDAEQVVDCVTASMTAAGLAGLSQVTDCNETMHQARLCYGLALKLTNDALRDPIEAVKDTTMLAVLILGSYEFISGRCPHTMRAWQDHVNGAAALASMRGSAQFSTKTGIRMFLMLSHSVLISCIQSGLPMPQVMIDLRKELRDLNEYNNPAWQIMDPIHKALQVRYDIKTGVLNDVDQIVRILSNIDDEFARLLSNFPPEWKYRPVQLTRPDPRVLGRRCHVYPGLLQVTTWNGARAIRMLVQETILEQLCSGGIASSPWLLMHHHQVQVVKAIKLLEKLGDAIVASVPQHFGVVSFRDVHSAAATGAAVSVSAQRQPQRVPSPSRPNLEPPSVDRSGSPASTGTPTLLDPTLASNNESDAERFMTLASASNTIIWPLYILGMSSTCPSATKAYAIDRLHAIHKETGLEQARVVAGMLQAKEHDPSYGGIPLDRLPELPHGALPGVV